MDIRQATPAQLFEQLAQPEIPSGVLENAMLWLNEARCEKMVKDGVKLSASVSWTDTAAQSLITFNVRTDADIDWWRNTLFRDPALVPGQASAHKGKSKCITVKWCSEGIDSYVEGGVARTPPTPTPDPTPDPVAAPAPAPVAAPAPAPAPQSLPVPTPVPAPVAPVPTPASTLPQGARDVLPLPPTVKKAIMSSVPPTPTPAPVATPAPAPVAAPAPAPVPTPLIPAPPPAPVTLTDQAQQYLVQQEAEVLALLTNPSTRDTVLARNIIGQRALVSQVAAQGVRLTAAEVEMAKLRKELEEHRAKPTTAGSGSTSVFTDFKDWIVDEPIEAGLVAAGSVVAVVGLKMLYDWMSASAPTPQNGE